MIFGGQNVGLIKTEVLPRQLLERSRKNSVCSPLAPIIQLLHNSAASFWNCHGTRVHWAGMGLGDKLALDTLGKASRLSLYCALVLWSPCVALIGDLIYTYIYIYIYLQISEGWVSGGWGQALFSSAQ